MKRGADLSRVRACYRLAVLRGLILTAESLLAVRFEVCEGLAKHTDAHYRAHLAWYATHGHLQQLRLQFAQLQCSDRAEPVPAICNALS